MGTYMCIDANTYITCKYAEILIDVCKLFSFRFVEDLKHFEFRRPFGVATLVETVICFKFQTCIRSWSLFGQVHWDAAL